MQKQRAGRNRTIFLSDIELTQYSERCLAPVEPMLLNEVIDKVLIGDSFDVLPLLPHGFVDLLVVDPPYNLNKSFGDGNFKKISDDEYAGFTERWIALVKPLLKPTASIYVCCDWRSSLIIGQVLQKYFDVQNRITWQREKGRGATRNWKNSMEDIWFATMSQKSFTFNVDDVKMRRKVIAPYKVDGKPKDWMETEHGNFRDTFPSNFWDDISVPYWSMPENTDHPTQKPEKLIAKLVLASSNHGDVVFDPFLGSGTTAVVARKLGRHFVGVEGESMYCALAQKRLEIASSDTAIQGYSGGVFWERNTLALQQKFKDTQLSNHPIERSSDQTVLFKLTEFIRKKDGINDKVELAGLVCEQFSCVKDGSVFYTAEFAIRFCKADSAVFSNTVLALSRLQKYDDRPFIVCACTPNKNHLLIANSTFLSKISHSSKELRVDNIKGSFNGSDIDRIFGNIENAPKNFEALFGIHESMTFEENLGRLVESTNDIVPKGKKFDASKADYHANIIDSPNRAVSFSNSDDYLDLLEDLNQRVREHENEILVAVLIENVNIRGRIIEYLIAGDDEIMRQEIIKKLFNKTELPRLVTNNDIGDYPKHYPNYYTKTDIKTKIMVLSSAPKGYNLDKILEFLSQDDTVFMIFLVGIDYESKSIKTKLVSMFQETLIDNTIIQGHWAGRNSRGASQFNGEAVKRIILHEDNKIDTEKARDFLDRILVL